MNRTETCPHCESTDLRAEAPVVLRQSDAGAWSIDDTEILPDGLPPHVFVLCNACEHSWHVDGAPTIGRQLDALLASNDVADAVGRALVDLLQLRTRRDNGRIDTAIGDKTPAGVARTVARWLAENIERDNGRDAA